MSVIIDLLVSIIQTILSTILPAKLQVGGSRKSPRRNRSNLKKKRLSKRKPRETFQQGMVNIYDEPLAPCREGNMSNGSWDSAGKCSELGGGVHQICVKEIATNAKGFSSRTGQSNWSDQRGTANHCVCLGAWSLYNDPENTAGRMSNKEKILKCEAIPKNALSDNYVSRFSEGWNKWNGLEINDQIVHGVEKLMENCHHNSVPAAKRNKLRQNYCNFARNHEVLRNRPLYRRHCQRDGQN